MSLQRIRTIKPDFFVHEDLARVSFAGRLLYIGLWTVADREGRLEDRPTRLKVLLFPYDPVDVDALLTDLAARGFIRRYEVDGHAYIDIPTFLKHQRPGSHEIAHEIPPCTNLFLHERINSGGMEGKGREGKGTEGKGTEEKKLASLAKKSSRDERAQRASTWPQDFKLTDDRATLATEVGVEMPWEWNKFKDHHRAKGSRFVDWDAAWRTWIRNAVEFGERRMRR